MTIAVGSNTASHYPQSQGTVMFTSQVLLLLRTCVAGCAILLVANPSVISQVSVERANSGIDRSSLSNFSRMNDGSLLAGSPSGGYRFDSQNQMWEYLGPEHRVHVIQQAPNGDLFAGTDRGIFRSSDLGDSWRNVYAVSNVGQFAFLDDGSIIGKVESAGSGRIMYVSTDGGQNWSSPFFEFYCREKSGIVAFGNVALIASKTGIRQSFDGGQVWEATRFSRDCSALIKADDGTAATAVDAIGSPAVIYESRDTGSNWTVIDTLPEGSDVIELSRSPDGSYFALVSDRKLSDGDNATGVWHLTSSADDATHLNASFKSTSIDAARDRWWLASNFRAIQYDVTGASVDRSAGLSSFHAPVITTDRKGNAYALVPDRSFRLGLNSQLSETNAWSLFHSDNAGLTWEERLDSIGSLQIEVDEFGNLYSVAGYPETDTLRNGSDTTAYFSNVLVSTDRGETWQTLDLDTIESVASDASAGVVAVSSGSDIVVSYDAGQTWAGFTAEDMPWQDDPVQHSSIAILPSGDLLVSIRENVATDNIDETAIWSFDKDQNGTQVNTMRDFTVMAVAEDGDVIAGGGTINTDVPGGRWENTGLYRSSDDGLSFDLVHPFAATFSDIVVEPNGYVLATTASRTVLPLFSNDGGYTWTQPLEHLERIQGGNGDTVFALGRNGFVTSSDRGASWNQTEILGIQGDLTTFALTNGTLLFGTMHDGIFRSTGLSDVPAAPAVHLTHGYSVRSVGAGILLNFDGYHEQVVEVRLFDATGRHLQSWSKPQSTGGSTLLRLDTYAVGTYFLRIRTLDSMKSIPIVLSGSH